MGLCAGKQALAPCVQPKTGPSTVVNSSPSATARYRAETGASEAPSLSAVAGETSARRQRLIHHTVGDIALFYDVESRKLGQGAFGSVCKGTSQETGVCRAIKSLSKARAVEVRKRYRQEMTIMKMTDHPNIIKLYETFEDKSHMFLVMELCSGGDVMKRLMAIGRFSESDSALLMKQILRSVFYMHTKGLCHRDVKPENFLFLTQAPVAENTVKIIDFGLSCQMKENQVMTTKLGTPAYSSPQVFAGQYDQSCDLWSCGVMLYFMLSGQPPFQGRSDNEVIQNVRRGNYAFPGSLWEDIGESAKDLVRRLLKYSPQDRATPEQALHHTYLRSHRVIEGGLATRLTPSLLMDLRSFCSQSLLRRAALQVMALQLGEHETDILRRAFEALDMRGAGVLTIAELKAHMDSQEMGDLRPELDRVVKELATPGPGVGGKTDNTEIAFTDFLAATLEAKHFQKEGACRAAFRAFDRNGDGQITAKELAEVLIGDDGGPETLWITERSTVNGMAGESSEKARGRAEMMALISAVDVNGDGVIDFDEFKLMLQGSKISAI
mmetsp:Transcript_91275/g.190889  ORF Transcript_91275/g.190889 Transcript_91275/m.190889 type:complete len:553 (+) Transcript_91275:253-1911(+)